MQARKNKWLSVKKTVSIFIVFTLVLSAAQTGAFASVIGWQEGNDLTKAYALPDEGTPSGDTFDEDNSDGNNTSGQPLDGSQDGADPEGVDPSGGLDGEQLDGDEAASLDALTDEQADAITPYAATATVTTEPQFRTALADASITTIYLGANISMPAATSATVADRSLVISGVDPLDPGATVHTYSDYPSATAGYGGLIGTSTDVTFRDLNVNLSNYYGIYGNNTANNNETVTFDNVTGSGPQFFHYHNTSAGSTFIVKDSNLILRNGFGGISGELAEADRVIFRGTVNLTRTDSSAFSIFWLVGTYASVTVENGAQVTIDNSNNATAGGELFYAANGLTIGNNATFNFYTRQGFTVSGTPAISVGQASSVKLIYTGTVARSGYYLQASSFTVGLKSRVLIYDNSSSAYGALHVTGTVTLNNPESFVVLNANSWVMGYLIPTSLAASQIKSIRYYTGASQIAGVYDSTNREYVGTDASPFGRWWAQKTPFSVSAGSWPMNPATAVSTTPAYTSANIPDAALAAGATTTLTNANFGLYTATSYGYAFEGETTATVTLDYYFDGVKDPAKTAVITPSLLATLAVSDVALATTPPGYVLSGTPTTPTLPASAQSLNGQTVRVDYVTDPAQTASIAINYYFNGVHNTSENTSITPQILSSVTVAQVALSTPPPGYMLASTPTTPTLPASAQSLNGQTVRVDYVTDPAQTATIALEYYLDGVHDSARNATITPQVLSTVGVAQVALGTAPLGFTLSGTPTSPVLPATALSLNNTTIRVYYVTDPAQTASIAVNYYFNGVHSPARDATITPHILSTVSILNVALSSIPVGYMLSGTPTTPTLPASAQSLNGQTVRVDYVTDPAQTATIALEYYLNGVHDPARNASITPQVLSTVGIASVALTTTPAGYTLSGTPTTPVLPASAQSLNGQTVRVDYVTDPAQTATITINYYLNGVHNSARDTTITPQVLSTVGVAQVALNSAPAGYMLNLVPTSPTLPASAQILDGTTVNVYYVSDPAQTASITLNYYFDGLHNSSYDTSITPQLLSAVSITQAGLTTVPSGYMLSTTPTVPALPATALSLDGATVNVYYLTDPSQTTSIAIDYYLNGVLDATRYASISPQVLSTVQLSDVVLATTPVGYMLASTPTTPSLPASAQSLDGQRVRVDYITDPTQTASIAVNYYFDSVHDSGRDTAITRQALASVALADVALAATPAGYLLAATPTSPVLPAGAQSLSGTTVNVYYVTDPTQTASIAVNYYFNAVHNASYDDLITPQLLAAVSISDVALGTVPTGYMLDTPAASPALPASAQSLDGGTVSVYYVTDSAQEATINIEYYFDNTHDASRDTTLTKQALASVTLEDVELSPAPVGYALATTDPPTDPVLPQIAYTLDGETIRVYYVLDQGQTACIDVGYYFDGILNGNLSKTITPQIVSSVFEADVVLGTLPTGYQLAATPTDPVLPANAQDLNGTTVNVYYTTDPTQTVSIDLEYYFDGVYDPGYDSTITPQILATVGLFDVALAVDPEGYSLGNTPTVPTLPASAESLDGTTVSVYYVTDASETATISVGYYFDGVLNAGYSTTLTPQILATVNTSAVTLGSVPVGYMLAATPTSPVLPASAHDLNGTTVNVYYTTDPAQTASITVNYYFDGVYDSAFNTTIEPQVLAAVTTANVALASTPVGFMLDAPATDPVLPASALVLDGTTVNVYYVTNPSQTVTINVAYYLNGVLNPAYNSTITPHILAQVHSSDVVLATTPAGYVLDASATTPALPASAQSLSGQTVSVYYVTDPTQTVSIDLEYYFDGVYDPGYDATLTPQLLATVGIANVALVSAPAGYTLRSIPTSPTLPASAESLDGTTISVYYVTDADQTATISVGYYFDNVLNASLSTTITPQLLSTVNVVDVTLSTVPVGYALAATPTSPTLPASATALNGTTVRVDYLTDPAQTASITLNYYFNDVHDAAYDATLTPQILSSVGISSVALSIVPAGYVLATTPTTPVLPSSADTLNNTTVNVYYVTDSSQTASITLNYYLNGVHNASLDTSIAPQVLSLVTLSQVVLSTTPVGYMLAATPTDPVLPASALSLDTQTVRVDYVTDPTQTASVTVNYYFNATYDSSYDATLTPQVLSTIGIANVALSTAPAGYMLDVVSTAPSLPASAQSLGGSTLNVYYVSDPTQTATITLEYYFNGIHDPSYDAAITLQVLLEVVQSGVVLATTPVGYMLDTPATAPILPAQALMLDGTTISIFYVSASEQITASNFRYALSSGALSSSNAIANAQVLAYDSQGMPLPASSITVDEVQLAALNAAIAANTTSGNPYLLTFYTPDGSSFTVEVTLYSDSSSGGGQTGTGSGSALANTGDQTGLAWGLLIAAALLGVFLLIAFKRRRKKKNL